MKTHLIHIVYEADLQPFLGVQLPREDEVVLVDAETLQDARDTASRHSLIAASGRRVRYYDEDGRELIGNSR